jgi:hypothetical protein
MCYSVDSDEEMHHIVEGLLHDRVLFVVVMSGDEWVQTTLVHAHDDLAVEARQVARIVSWSGRYDRTVIGGDV